MEIKQNKSSGQNATRCRCSGKLMRIDRASGVKRSWVILVWALIATLWCVDAANQQQHQTLAIKQQPNSAKNDFDKRNAQIPIAQQEATSTEKLEAIGKNSSLSDDLLVAASSTTASTLVTSSAPVQQRQSSVATTGNGEIRGAADTTATSASSPSTPAVGSTTESSKRRPTAAGSAKLTQSTSVNRHLASGGRQQKQHANEPQSQRLPSAAGSESRQHSSAGTELIERMSTSRSVTFAEPPAEGTGNKISRQLPAQVSDTFSRECSHNNRDEHEHAINVLYRTISKHSAVYSVIFASWRPYDRPLVCPACLLASCCKGISLPI